MLIIPFLTVLLIAPDLVTEMITFIRVATPGEITTKLRFLLVFSGLVEILLALPLAILVMRFRFGYINKFESAIRERISMRIRAILEVPAEGDVDVHVGKGFRV